MHMEVKFIKQKTIYTRGKDSTLSYFITPTFLLQWLIKGSVFEWQRPP